MANRTALAICFALLSGGAASAVSAQDAAETAVILSGVGQSQGGASRSLGSAVSQSLNTASDALRARPNSPQPVRRHRARTAAQTTPLPANVDMLEGTDAPTYAMGNGASIRVSGRLIPAPQAACTKDCPAPPAP